MKKLAVITLALILSLVSIQAAAAQGDEPPPCPELMPDGETPAGCPTVAIYGEGLVGDIYLDEQLLAEGQNPAQLQNIPAAQSLRLDVRNIRDGSADYGVLYEYRDAYTYVWVNQGQIRTYVVYPQKQFIRGTLLLTCDIRQRTETDALACLVVIDDVPQEAPIPAGEAASYTLDPGTHTVQVSATGAGVELWSPAQNTHSARIYAGGTTRISSIFQKSALLHISLNADEGTVADFYVDGELVAQQVPSVDTWVTPYQNHTIKAENIAGPSVGDVYGLTATPAYAYASPGQERSVVLHTTKAYIKGFLKINCRIDSLGGAEAYCQPYIDGQAVEGIPPGDSRTYNVATGTHEVMVVVGPEWMWWSDPYNWTITISPGYTVTYHANFIRTE